MTSRQELLDQKFAADFAAGVKPTFEAYEDFVDDIDFETFDFQVFYDGSVAHLQPPEAEWLPHPEEIQSLLGNGFLQETSFPFGPLPQAKDRARVYRVVNKDDFANRWYEIVVTKPDESSKRKFDIVFLASQAKNINLDKTQELNYQELMGMCGEVPAANFSFLYSLVNDEQG
jgi:hypothetical protein